MTQSSFFRYGLILSMMCVAIYSGIVIADANIAKTNVDKCHDALFPQTWTTSTTATRKKAWLILVTQSQFEINRHKLGFDTGAEVGLPVEGIPIDFSGYFKGNWEDFQKKRSEWLSYNGGMEEEAFATATARQYLEQSQLDAFVACMGQQAGLTVTVSDESEFSANAIVTLQGGIPGEKSKIKVELLNGTVGNDKTEVEFDLAQVGGSEPLIITRKGTANDRNITVSAKLPGALASIAMSLWPPPKKDPEPSTPTSFTTTLSIDNIFECKHRGGKEPKHCIANAGFIFTPPAKNTKAYAKFNIPPGTRWFVGTLTEYSGNDCFTKGSVQSAVFVDNIKVTPSYQQKGLKNITLKIPIPSNAKILELRSTDDNDNIECDDPAWMTASFRTEDPRPIDK